jgi:hypothetical protein
MTFRVVHIYFILSIISLSLTPTPSVYLELSTVVSRYFWIYATPNPHKPSLHDVV